MNIDFRKVGMAIAISCVLSLFFTSILFHSDIKEKLTELIDDREVIDLVREDYPYSAHSWMIDEGHEITRLANEDMSIFIECENKYYVAKGITFSFTLKDEGINSLSKEELKLPAAHIYLIHDGEVISSLETWSIDKNRLDFNYDKGEPPHQRINAKKMLDGEYKYHFSLTPDDIGKWRLLLLGTDIGNTKYNHIGKKIEWEERIFEVTLSDPPIFPRRGILLSFLTFLGLSYPLYKYYSKLEGFWENEKKSILEILVFYFLLILSLLILLAF
ncbi:MAG TPA: hypothetical protein ENI52_05630 [Thermoplasmata archaeon]|nr:hypothetical protein [Thermoplasmata archaeon]